MNKSIIFGNICQDLVINNNHCRFTLATNDKYKDREGNVQEKVYYHPCSIFGKQAEILQSFAVKGTRILVEGKLVSNKYQDNNGATRYDYRTIVDRFYLCPRQPQNEQAQPQNQYAQPQQQQRGYPPPVQQDSFPDDDLPF